MSGGWINTWTGKQFFPLEPDLEQVDIRDIAHALARVCRYTGHVEGFYSVAEHSVKLAQVCQARGLSQRLMKYALLHDASEAYLNDVVRPLKYLPEFEFYREAESSLQLAFYRRYGLVTEPGIIRTLDHDIVATEKVNVCPNRHPEWKTGPTMPELDGVSWGWTPERAERMFLDVFETLFIWRGWYGSR